MMKILYIFVLILILSSCTTTEYTEVTSKSPYEINFGKVNTKNKFVLLVSNNEVWKIENFDSSKSNIDTLTMIVNKLKRDSALILNEPLDNPDKSNQYRIYANKVQRTDDTLFKIYKNDITNIVISKNEVIENTGSSGFLTVILSILGAIVLLVLLIGGFHG